jgi:hypothetical protein
LLNRHHTYYFVLWLYVSLPDRVVSSCITARRLQSGPESPQ